MNQRVFKVFACAMALCSVIAISSCEKDKETLATVLVMNEDGAPVPGATVRLYSNPSPDSGNNNELRFDDTATTNGSGKATFNYTEDYKKGQAGFAVLDIEAFKGGLTGSGIIKIEEEQTTEESVTIE